MKYIYLLIISVLFVFCKNTVYEENIIEYYSVSKKITVSYPKGYKVYEEGNRIIAVDICDTCDFKTNIVFSIYENINDSSFLYLKNQTIIELKNLADDISIITDSPEELNNQLHHNFMYDFESGGIELKAVSKILYFRNIKKVVTVNCMSKKSEFSTNDLLFKTIFSNVFPD